MASWLASFFTEFEGRNLQRSGPLTKDQVMQFFHYGTHLFNNMDFKKALSQAHRAGQPLQELIDQAQRRIWEDKVQPAVQGDYGIDSMSRVLDEFGKDAEFAKTFYEFVHLEEKTMDEAEMRQDEFEKKYQMLDSMKQQFQSKMKEHEADVQKMTEEEKQQFMARMYKAVVDASLSMSDQGHHGSCCASGSCGPSLPPRMAPPTQAPQVEELPSRTDWRA